MHLLKGLNARIVPISSMNAVARLDADYAAHPMADYLDHIAARPDAHPLSELLSHISSGHTPYMHDVSQGEVGFATVECVAPLRFHDDKLKRITQDQFDGEFSRQRVTKGSVLCTIKRRICQAYPWVDAPDFPLAINQDVALLKPRPEINSAYLACYLSSELGQSFANRQQTEQINPYMSLVNLRTLPIVMLSKEFQSEVEQQFLRISALEAAAKNSMDGATEILLARIGLKEWNPSNPLTSEASSNVAFSARRLDAQYFRPMFIELEEQLKATGAAVELEKILKSNARGRQPKYSETGLPVINSKHVRTNRVVLSGNRTATENLSPVFITKGDVLINGTGEGTIGRAAPYLHEGKALPDNHVTVLRTNDLDPVYLSVFLNSPLGQWQVERHIRGSSGQVELYPSDISKIIVWQAPSEVQEAIRDAVTNAFEEERKADELLKALTHSIKIAVDESEEAALAILASVEGTS